MSDSSEVITKVETIKLLHINDLIRHTNELEGSSAELELLFSQFEDITRKLEKSLSKSNKNIINEKTTGETVGDTIENEVGKKVGENVDKELTDDDLSVRSYLKDIDNALIQTNFLLSAITEKCSIEEKFKIPDTIPDIKPFGIIKLNRQVPSSVDFDKREIPELFSDMTEYLKNMKKDMTSDSIIETTKIKTDLSKGIYMSSYESDKSDKSDSDTEFDNELLNDSDIDKEDIETSDDDEK